MNGVEYVVQLTDRHCYTKDPAVMWASVGALVCFLNVVTSLSSIITIMYNRV